MTTQFNVKEKKITFTNVFFPKSCFHFANPSPTKRTLPANSPIFAIALIQKQIQTFSNSDTLQGCWADLRKQPYPWNMRVAWVSPLWRHSLRVLLSSMSWKGSRLYYGNIYWRTLGMCFLLLLCPPWCCCSCQLPPIPAILTLVMKVCFCLWHLTHNVMVIPLSFVEQGSYLLILAIHRKSIGSPK